MQKFSLLFLIIILIAGCDQTTKTNTSPTETTTPSAHKTNKNSWKITTQTTNKGTNYLASLKASSVHTSFNNPVTLTILCNKNTMALTLNWGQHVLLGSKMSAYVKFNDEHLINTPWRYTVDTENAYAQMPQELIQKIATSERALITTHFFQGMIASAIFDLYGAKHAIEKITRACRQ